MSRLTIEIGHEEHDVEIYYRVLEDDLILVEMYKRKELMIYLENKIKSMEKNHE